MPSLRIGHAREPHGQRSLDAHRAFRDSMPDRYSQAFDGASIREHAAIVTRRAGAPAHVEIWRREPKEQSVMCIVADDKPGLLSLISASLAAESLDVVSAQAYTRTAPGGAAEAVDFVWVRRAADRDLPVRNADALRIAELLGALINGQVNLEAIVSATHKRSNVPRGATTRVVFEEAPTGGVAVMTVETFDRPGLLLAIALALFRARVQIVASDVSTDEGRVIDRFTLTELDGSPIVRNRRGAVQTAVLAAIGTLSR